MKKEDVLKQYTTPTGAPAFVPGPHRFTSREYLNITYRTDREALQKQVPEPLEIDEPLVRFEVMNMPDTTGYGSYVECGQAAVVRHKEEVGEYIIGMYLDNLPAIAAGRELSAFPKKLGSAKLFVDSDTLVGTLDYGTLSVARATMGYKHKPMDLEKARQEICVPTFMLKILPSYEKRPRICELVRTEITNISVKGAWRAPARLPHVETIVRDYIRNNRSTLKALGLPTDDLEKKLSFEANLERSVTGADLVQENGPERIEFKQDLWAHIGKVVGEHALMLSSSSAKTATEQSLKMPRPDRLLVGHPFNPPHLIPLVEVVPGEKTSPEAVDDAVAFYAALGKVPRVVRKEMPGFVANRLQRAIFRECCYLVIQGVVKVDELDDIVTSSIGLRWAADGQFRSFHLGGGAGGFKSFFNQFGPGLNEAWKNMAPVNLDEAAQDKIVAQAEASFAAQPPEQLESERDAKQLAIIRALKAVKASQ